VGFGRFAYGVFSNGEEIAAKKTMNPRGAFLGGLSFRHNGHLWAIFWRGVYRLDSSSIDVARANAFTHNRKRATGNCQ